MKIFKPACNLLFLSISMAVALSHTCDQTVDLGLVPSLGRQSA
ncbi:hypothetical protein T01_12808 [Trichinella spiralis]|uniref:Uncharacterized protein n=1 Tax=Trichinella spiralis TaxID=6334 RepID=A0A0V0YUX3_TRISP|nr:hypothetical protein T01_12808 [Trichinella spiralis]